MFTVVNAEDWVGIYLDGKLLAQGHSFSEREVLGIAGMDAESVWVDDPTGILGYFPDDIDKLEAEGWQYQ